MIGQAAVQKMYRARKRLKNFLGSHAHFYVTTPLYRRVFCLCIYTRAMLNIQLTASEQASILQRFSFAVEYL